MAPDRGLKMGGRHLKHQCVLNRAFWLWSLILWLFVAVEAVRYVHPAERKAIYYRERRKARARRMQEWEDLRRSMPHRQRLEECSVEGDCVFLGVQVSLAEHHGLVFCRDCPDPHLQGSFMNTWEAFVHPPHFHVDGELVYGVPNDASRPLLNAVGGTVVLLDRGGSVPIVDKVLRAQEAGALAVVIVDDGSCSPSFECGGALGSAREGGLAYRDSRDAWSEVFIPAVLVTREDGERLRAQLELMEMHVDELGWQRFVPESTTAA